MSTITFTTGSGNPTSIVDDNLDDIVIVDAGSRYLYADAAGHTTFQFGASFGQDYVATLTPSTSLSGIVSFTATKPNQLWFQQVGNDLKIILLGTSDAVTVVGYFSGQYSLSAITAMGNTLDVTTVTALVTAMQTYSAHNAAFDPTKTSAFPTDSALQLAYGNAWYSNVTTTPGTDGSITGKSWTYFGGAVAHEYFDVAHNDALSEKDIVYADHSKLNTAYDTTGGAWKDGVFAYNAAGVETSSRWDNNDSSSFTSLFDAASGALVANLSVNADGSGYLGAVAGQEVDFAGGNVVTDTIDANDHVTLNIAVGGNNATPDTISLNGSTVIAGTPGFQYIPGYQFTDYVGASSISLDKADYITFISPLTGFGSDTLKLGLLLHDATFTIGKDTISFADLTAKSMAYASGVFTFGLIPVGQGYGEALAWNPTTGKAILDITNAAGKVFASSLGYINPGDTLNVTSSLISLKDSGGQTLNATEINSNGNQYDHSYNTTGTGVWSAITYGYDASGNQIELRYDNKDGTFVDHFYNAAGVETGTAIDNGDGILHVSGTVRLSGADIAGVKTLSNTSGSAVHLIAEDHGTYDLSRLTTIGNFNLDASQAYQAILIGNGQAQQTLTGGDSNTTLVAGTGNDTLNAGAGYMTYKFGPTFGQDVINNNGIGGVTYGTSPYGEIDFGTGITDEKLWFKRSGNNLEIDLLGTVDKVTVTNWFSDPGAPVESIQTASGLKIDSQVTQLVSAMATYASAHTGFNPATATSMPTDATLQNAIVAAWHS